MKKRLRSGEKWLLAITLLGIVSAFSLRFFPALTVRWSPRIIAQPNEVAAAAFAADSNTIFILSRDNDLALYDLEQNKNLWRKSFGDWIYVPSLSPDAENFVVGIEQDHGASVQQHSMGDGRALWKTRVRIPGAAIYSDDGKRIEVAGSGHAELDAKSGRVLWQDIDRNAYRSSFDCVSRDNRWRAEIRKSKNSSTLQELRLVSQKNKRPICVLAKRDDFDTMFFSHDSKSLVTETQVVSKGRSSSLLEFWDVATGKKRFQQKRPGSAQVRSRGGFFVCARTVFKYEDASKTSAYGSDMFLECFSSNTGAMLWSQFFPLAGAEQFAISQSGKMIAAVVRDKKSVLEVFDVSDGKTLCRLPLQTSSTCAPDFSPDDSHLAIGDGERVLVWNIQPLQK